MTITLPWPLPRFVHSNSDIPRVPTPSMSLSSLLRHYETPGISPPSSRVTPTVKRRETPSVRLWDLWKYGFVFARKATEVTGDVISHHVWGPRKPSWGIEMTIITSLMRNVSRHSSLIDIGTIRLVMSLTGFVPLPSDARVTPVTFRVRRRHLRGILADFDAKETGDRELSGEWVVGKRLWLKLQADWKAAQKRKDQGGPNPVQEEKSQSRHQQKHRVVLYLHGGAYYVSSAAAQRLISIPLSKYVDARVFALDYRLAPETCFPGPLHDAVSAYLRLIDDLYIPPENIVVAGDSAGGGLSLALLLYLRDNDYPLPSGAILMSPWVDLTMSCESIISNAPFDVVPLPEADDHLNPVSLYLGDGMEQYLMHPYVSPLFGDLKGLPPLLIQSGDAEVLRDEHTLLAHKASLAGVHVQHELYEDAIHVFQMYPFLEASHRSFLSCRAFVRAFIPDHHASAPQPLNRQTQSQLETEIDNEHVRVVSGDGIESVEGAEIAQPETEDGGISASEGSSQEDDPSWVPGQLQSPPTSDDEDSQDTPLGHRSPRSSRPVSPSQSTQTLRRIQSALSILVPNTVSPPSLHHGPRSPSASTRNHHRTLSGQSRRGFRSRKNTMTMSTMQPPPSPSIRRGANSTSHQDLTTLVAQWKTGPANHTTLYRPHNHGK